MDDDDRGCLHAAASAGLFTGIAGTVLVFVVPGGLWSDVPGYVLGGTGALVELVCTAAIVVARLRRP